MGHGMRYKGEFRDGEPHGCGFFSMGTSATKRTYVSPTALKAANFAPAGLNDGRRYEGSRRLSTIPRSGLCTSRELRRGEWILEVVHNFQLYVANLDGNFPMSLVGIAFLQREVSSGDSVNRHVTALSRSAVMEYLEKVRPVQR